MATVPSPSNGQPSAKGGCGRVTLGLIVTLVGIPLLVLPGPGLLVIGIGLALVARGLGFRTGFGEREGR